MRADGWGTAFFLAVIIHIAVLAVAVQGVFAEIALEPKIEYMEIELAPPTPVREQVQSPDVPVVAASQGKNTINNRVNTANKPATAGFAAVGEQNNSLTGIATVSEGGQVMNIPGGGFDITTGLGESATGGTASAQPRVERAVDRRPSVAYKAPPNYPSEARRNRWQGAVFISALIEASGNVTDVRVAESSGYDVLDLAAADVVLNRWRFNPAYRDGQPVPARVRVSVTFSLD